MRKMWQLFQLKKYFKRYSIYLGIYLGIWGTNKDKLLLRVYFNNDEMTELKSSK